MGGGAFYTMRRKILKKVIVKVSISIILTFISKEKRVDYIIGVYTKLQNMKAGIYIFLFKQNGSKKKLHKIKDTKLFKGRKKVKEDIHSNPHRKK